MLGYTISVMVGKGSTRHNSRRFIAENVDKTRTYKNIEYCDDKIENVYHELFDEAQKRYNDKQKRSDRKIDNYYEKIRTSKQEKIFHEIILQIGSTKDIEDNPDNAELFKTILDEYYRGFTRRNKNLRVFSAHIHMDESTPHIHIDFVPYTKESKRGMDTRVSLKQALAEQGFTGEGKNDTEWNRWVQSEKEKLAEVMKEYGLEWEQKNTHDRHLSVLDFKVKERREELADLDSEVAEKEKKSNEIDKKLEKNKEKSAYFEEKLKAVSDSEVGIANFDIMCKIDPTYKIPEPGTLMTARSYMKNLIIPWFRRIKLYVSDLWNLYAREKMRATKLERMLETENKQLAFYKGKFDDAQKMKEDYIEEKYALNDEVQKYRLLKAVYGKDKIAEWEHYAEETEKKMIEEQKNRWFKNNPLDK